MRIVSVYLKNIKSHRETELSFSPGINVLSGANGSGKSTIFQAIGYALFGVNAQDFTSRADRFLTIGTKRGEVGVVFEPAEGERYRVTRTVGPAGKWLLAKETGGAFEIEEHANSQETEQRIASLLGLAGGRPLADQFKLVIGPFQNDFLGPFVIRQPTKRQDAFDEILGIDAWRKTFDGTKLLASAIAARTDTLQAEVAGKQEQVAVLPAKELEYASLRENSSAKEAELKKRTGELAEVTAQLAALDARKKKIEAARNAVQGIEERISSGKDHVTNQQLLVEQSKEAAGVVAAASAGKQAYDAAEARLKELREQEKQKSLVEKKLAELDKEQSGIRATLAIEERELADLRSGMDAEAKKLSEEESSLAAQRAELATVQAQAAELLAAVNRAVATFRELPVHRIDSVLPYLFTGLDRMATIDGQSAEKGRLIAGSEALEAAAAELPHGQAELEKVQGKRAELSGRKLSLIEGCEKIGDGNCPFLQEPCKNVDAAGGLELMRVHIQELDAEIAGLDAQAEALTGQVASAQAAAHELAGVEHVRGELGKLATERDTLEQDFTRKLSEIAPAALLASVTGWLATNSPEPSPTFSLAKGEGQGGGALPDELKPLRVEIAGPPSARRAQLSIWSDQWHNVIASLERGLEDRLKEAEEPVRNCAIRAAGLDTGAKALEGKKRELAAAGEKVVLREKTIETQQKRLHAVVAGVGAEKQALSAYAGLEDAVRAAGEELERYQPERDRFIANETAAAELEKRTDTLTKYQKRLQELGAQLALTQQELQELLAGYQAERHENVRNQRELVMAAMATLKAEMAGIAEGMVRLEGEIAALTAVAQEIQRKLAAIDKLQEQGALVKFLRNQVFKNVSSQLSERFREEISTRADRIYRCISESDEELYWGENYQVVLKDMMDGQIRERTDDQLSGGQMMSAVVSLRLALLQTIGARIAFFDEPTSNLDAERRENLAKAFRAIDVGQEEVTEHWYDQLFLVSHDVSFTEITDQMIHLD
ncbi:MAG TPA: SMC family ATPase [Geomonas sp.]|nr:SMC family ATPase [Geomonas sp.]